MKNKERVRRGSIPGAWIWRSIEMLESPAYRALSLSAHRILARLEIELYQHGGKPEENGRLACTFEHFVQYGIDRHAIAPAIRETVALGFVEITRQGSAGNAGFRQPTLYRLTYRHTGSDKRITDEWRKIAHDLDEEKALDEAEAIAESARSTPSARPKKIKVQWGKPTPNPVGETHTEMRYSPVGETPTTAPVGETPTTSISRRGVTARTARTDPSPTAADGRPDAPQPTLRLAHDAERPTLRADDGLRLKGS